MIDTLRIFQELSQTMDPAAARKLAEILGLFYQELQNTVTKTDFAELKEIVRDLAEAQKRTEVALKLLIERVEAQEVRLAKLDGRTLESQFRDKASAYLGSVLRGVRVIAAGDLAEELETVLSEDEWRDLLRTDVVARGKALIQGRQQEVYIVVEISVTLDEGDVVRAARRAALLRKKGWGALAVVAGEQASESVVMSAAARGVAVLRDGQQANWDHALAAA